MKRLIYLCMVISSGLVGCGSAETPTPTPEPIAIATADAGLVPTLRADAQATAESFDLTPTPAVDVTPAPELDDSFLAGTPLGQRRGACPVPDGFELQQRQGFCIATPAEWRILNVDGALAAFWGTTPGQAIGIQPDWAEDPTVCELTVYVAPAASAALHLSARYDEFQNRARLDEIAPETIQTEDGLAMFGFRWQSAGQRGGAIYADDLGQGRIVHISRTGTNCPLDAVLPVILTLRFNPA